MLGCFSISRLMRGSRLEQTFGNPLLSADTACVLGRGGKLFVRTMFFLSRARGRAGGGGQEVWWPHGMDLFIFPRGKGSVKLIHS
jgi:hypothetical protein